MRSHWGSAELLQGGLLGGRSAAILLCPSLSTAAEGLGFCVVEQITPPEHYHFCVLQITTGLG